MASTNQSPQYQKAQGMYLNAKTNEEKLKWLEEMMRECPKHKSAEKMLANLKTRYIKLKEKIEAIRKTNRGSKKQGIKKEEMQAVLVGFTNSGKSSLISSITNASTPVSQYPFTTKAPVIGMMAYSGTKIQLIEVPSLDSEQYDRGLVNNADVILILVDNLDQIQKAKELLSRTIGKQTIILNKIDLLSELEKRKTESYLKSKKYDFLMISTKTREGFNELKDTLFKNFGKIRVFTKEPGKEKSNNPLILEPESSVKDIAHKIFKSTAKIKETRIWGPSSKFPGQIVGLQHKLKDMDVIEFKTR